MPSQSRLFPDGDIQWRQSVVAIQDIHEEDRIAELLVRYWGVGRRLTDSEKEVLLAALDSENKILEGPTHRRAIRRLADKGIT